MVTNHLLTGMAPQANGIVLFVQQRGARTTWKVSSDLLATVIVWWLGKELRIEDKSHESAVIVTKMFISWFGLVVGCMEVFVEE